MEKVRLTLSNGQDVMLEHNPVDKPFDDVMQFYDGNHVVKAKDGLRIPIRSIVTYQIMENSNG